MDRKRRQETLMMAGLILPTLAVVTWLSNAEKGLAASSMVGVFYTIIRTKSETRKESLSEHRFWAVIAILAVIHIVAISVIKFPELEAGLVSLPFALVDGFIMWGLIDWIERRFPRLGSRSER